MATTSKRSSSGDKVVSVSRVIDAPAAEIFAVVADPARHCEFDGSGTVKAARSSEPITGVGQSFSMDMKMGVPYRIGNTVKEFEQDRLIAWAHMGGHRWRYELAEVEGGTEVTESFDWSTASPPVQFFIQTAGYPDKHPKAMAATLERLDALLTGS